MTDWATWHEPYDDPDSPLSQRLRAVQEPRRARTGPDAGDPPVGGRRGLLYTPTALKPPST
jgi:hypothetical protein